MNETERNQIKGALLKCAKENENKVTPTFNVVVSSVCKSAVERIEELEKENAGLKAGRPQWHDLRKDPNDLPDEGVYLVVWQNARGYRERMIMKYEEDDEEELHWFDDENDCWDDDIIAWCEIPTFDKE